MGWVSRKYGWALESPGVVVNGLGGFGKHADNYEEAAETDEGIDQRHYPINHIPSQIIPPILRSIAMQKWDKNVEEWPDNKNVNGAAHESPYCTNTCC